MMVFPLEIRTLSLAPGLNLLFNLNTIYQWESYERVVDFDF